MAKSSKQQLLTPQELGWLQSLPAWQQLAWYLETYERAPKEAIEARIQLGIPIPDGLYDGYTKPDIAHVMGVMVQTVTVMQRNGMPFIAGGPGEPNVFNLRECVAWLVEKKSDRITADADKVAEADLRYREEKTREAVLRRRKIEGELIDVSEMERRINAVIDVVSKGTEQMHRAFGDECAEMFHRIIEDARSQLYEASEPSG